MNIKEEMKITNLIHKFSKELQIPIGFTDYNRQIVCKKNGIEEIVPVKHIYIEAKPNTQKNNIKTIIKEFTEQLNWEYLRVEKKVWVNENIRYEICFKL